MTLEESLQNAGFTLYEAKVYISLLDLGKSRLTAISRKAGMNHVVTLYNLRYLARKELVFREKVGKLWFYSIKPPREGLKEYIQKMEKEVSKKKTSIMESLEWFEMRHADIQYKPKVKFLEDRECLKGVFNEIQNTDFDELYEFTNLDEAYKVIPKKAKIAHRSALNKIKYNEFVIYTSEKGSFLPKTWKRTTRYFVSKKEFDFPGEISTFGDKVVLISFSPRYCAVIIRDASIASVVKHLFKLAIKGTERFSSHD